MLVVALAKRVRPLRVRLAREPHAIAAAVRSDLEAYVRDQGVRGPITALTPLEFGSMLKREFGVNGADWAGRAGPRPLRPGGRRGAGRARRATRGARAEARHAPLADARRPGARHAASRASLLPVRRDE